MKNDRVNHWETLDHLRNHPDMWVTDRSYSGLVSFIAGYDTALSGGLLNGFQEFVELKLGQRSNLHWSGLAWKLDRLDEPEFNCPDDNKITKLFDLLEEFLLIGNGPLERLRIHHEHIVMEQGQSWYDPDLIRFSRSPAPETMTIDEAAESLAIDRRLVMRLVRIPHFDGYPAVLIQLKAVTKRALREALIDGWLACAPDNLSDQYIERETDIRRRR